MVVGIHGRVQDADVGADASEVDAGNMALTQEEVQAGATEGGVAALVQQNDMVAVLVGLIPVFQWAIELSAPSARQIVRRKELGFRVIRVALKMLVGWQDDPFIGFVEFVS